MANDWNKPWAESSANGKPAGGLGTEPPVAPLPDDIEPASDMPPPVHHVMTAETGVFSDPAADLADATGSAGPMTATEESEGHHVLAPSTLTLEPEHTGLGHSLMLEIKRIRDHVLPHHAERGNQLHCSQIGAAVDLAQRSMTEGNQIAMAHSLEALKGHTV